jgi:predicted acetyltransferase
MIKLIKPDFYLRKEYTEMMDEWIKDGSRIAPWSLIEKYHSDNDFEKMIRIVNDAEVGNGIGDFSPCKTYWVKNIETNKLLGAINIRYYLTKLGFETWGHIGFGVRPSERKKGYATQMLLAALDECRIMKMEKVLIGCLDGNIASYKTIEKCGGILENTIIHEYNSENVLIRRYWIEV